MAEAEYQPIVRPLHLGWHLIRWTISLTEWWGACPCGRHDKVTARGGNYICRECLLEYEQAAAREVDRA